MSTLHYKDTLTSTEHLVSDPAWLSIGVLTVLIGPQLSIVLLQHGTPDIALRVDAAPA